MTTFKIATWNVENLFVPPDEADQTTKHAFEAKTDLLADAIKHLDPDLIAFQKVGDVALAQLKMKISAWEHAHQSGHGDGRGIRVGYLSKLALSDPQDIVDFPPWPSFQVWRQNAHGETVVMNHLGRGALQVRVSKGDKTFHVVTCHLKSKLLSYPRPKHTAFQPRDEKERAMVGSYALHQRTAEAATLRLHANALLEGDADTALILLGDFNDGPEAQTTQILYGPSGSQPGTGGFHPSDQGDDTRLFNTSYFIPEDERYSRKHAGRGEMLDQILVSEQLMPRGDDGKRVVPTEVKAHHDLLGNMISMVGNDPRLRAKELWPDHAPVTATFEW
jgi:exonuclease III